MKRNVLSCILTTIAALTVAGSTATLTEAQSGGYTVTIENRSAYNINQVFLSRSRSDYWGPDQLGRVVLESGYRITLPDTFFAGWYDLKLVDQDGDTCVVPRVYVNGNTTWNISNSWLLNCEFR